MTGWNMPPGCSPEDSKEESLYDAIYDALRPLDTKASLQITDEVVEALATIVADAWKNGYEQGAADVAAMLEIHANA